MEIKSVFISNFRNFKEIMIDLNNKNIIFGRNDFGKTNFLYALRFLFDNKIRRHGLAESDYYKKNTEEPIKIILEVKLGDDDDSNFLRVLMTGAVSFSDESNMDYPTVYIQLEAFFDENDQRGNPVLSWGGDKNELIEIRTRGYTSDLDKVFETTYIDPNINPDQLFKKHRTLLYKDAKSKNNDSIDEAIKKLNQAISDNTRVESIAESLTKAYHYIRKEDLSIELRSELEISGVFNHLVPYIRHEEDDEAQIYPTSGDGRKKLLAYALTEYIQRLKKEKETGKKIQIYLIEEVENSLHPKMQESLSRYLFRENSTYSYLFLSTHSEHMFSYADELNLVRILRQTVIITSQSKFYNVPTSYKKTRKTFNLLLGQALFVDRVLLVEGMSEKILFEAIIERLVYDDNYLNPMILEKVDILSVEGIGFTEYVKILKALNIEPIIKTDNDIKKVKEKQKLIKSGINRCKNLSYLLEYGKDPETCLN